jgi:enamine deaminase RidA (YjgF/YER057c/UK114 family)
MPKLEHPHPEGLPQNPVYSHVVAATGARIVHTAGQVAMDAAGALIGGDDLGAQTRQAMENVGLALAAAGAGFADVVKITTYVVNYRPEDRVAISRARAPFFEGRLPPASTLVGVCTLAMPEWLVEIEAVAVTD